MTSTALVLVSSPENLVRVSAEKAKLQAFVDALKAKPLVITTEAVAVAYSKALTEIHDTEKALEEGRKADKRPHLDAGKAVDELYNEPIAMAATVKAAVGRALGAFREREAAQKQAALAAAQALAQEQARQAHAAALAQQQAAISAAILTPGVPPAPVAPPPSPALAAATQRALIVAGTEQPSQIGGTRLGEEIEIVILDPAAVPREFCKPHEPLIKAAIKAGATSIPGVSFTRIAAVKPTGR